MGALDRQHVRIPNAIFDVIETGSAAETLAAGASYKVYGGSLSCCGGGCSKGRAKVAAKAGMGLAPVVAIMSPGMSLSRLRRFTYRVIGRLWWPT